MQHISKENSMRKMVCIKTDGFTLVELVITIAIIAILFSIATMEFRSWTVKTNIDKQTKELFGDISEARIRSQLRKQNHSILIESTSSYSFKSYSSENEPVSGGRKEFTKSLKYFFTSPAANTNIMFNTRGAIYSGFGNTIFIGPANSGAFDCIVIDEVRTNIGKTTNGNCVQ